MKKLSLFGLFLCSLTTFAKPVEGFKCNLVTRVAGTESVKREFISRPESKYFVVSQDIYVNNTLYNLHVYYDGNYSAINLYNKIDGPGKRYYNSDSEVGVGKLFSLNVQSLGAVDPQVDFVGISCKGF